MPTIRVGTGSKAPDGNQARHFRGPRRITSRGGCASCRGKK